MGFVEIHETGPVALQFVTAVWRVKFEFARALRDLKDTQAW